MPIQKEVSPDERRKAGHLRKTIYNKVDYSSYMAIHGMGETGGRRGTGALLLRQVRSAPSPPGGSCAPFSRSAGGLQAVSGLAVLREVQPHHLVLPRDAKPHELVEDLEQPVAHGEGVDQHGRN